MRNGEHWDHGRRSQRSVGEYDQHLRQQSFCDVRAKCQKFDFPRSETVEHSGLPIIGYDPKHGNDADSSTTNPRSGRVTFCGELLYFAFLSNSSSSTWDNRPAGRSRPPVCDRLRVAAAVTESWLPEGRTAVTKRVPTGE